MRSRRPSDYSICTVGYTLHHHLLVFTLLQISNPCASISSLLCSFDRHLGGNDSTLNVNCMSRVASTLEFRRVRDAQIPTMRDIPVPSHPIAREITSGHNIP